MDEVRDLGSLEPAIYVFFQNLRIFGRKDDYWFYVLFSTTKSNLSEIYMLKFNVYVELKQPVVEAFWKVFKIISIGDSFHSAPRIQCFWAFSIEDGRKVCRCCNDVQNSQ